MSDFSVMITYTFYLTLLSHARHDADVTFSGCSASYRQSH